MHAGQAIAVRRSMYAAAALAATLSAHAVATGGMHVARHAPVAWGMLLLLALMAGRRRGGFHARGPVAVMARLVAGQVLVHVALVQVPWAVGVQAHHPDPMVGPAAVAAHAVAAVLLGLLAMRGERLLAAAVGVAGAVRRYVADALRARGTRSATVRVRTAESRPWATEIPDADRTRGPPVPVIATA